MEGKLKVPFIRLSVQQLHTEPAAKSQALCRAFAEQRRFPSPGPPCLTGETGSEGRQNKARGKPEGEVTSAGSTCPIARAYLYRAGCHAAYAIPWISSSKRAREEDPSSIPILWPQKL